MQDDREEGEIEEEEEGEWEGEGEEQGGYVRHDQAPVEEYMEVGIGKDAAEELLSSATKGVDMQFVPRLVIPGDDVTDDVTRVASRVKIGSGLVNRSGVVRATKAGRLRYKPPNTYWVDNFQKRYIPKAEDAVIGIIRDRMMESYRVNIYGSTEAVLPILAFEGATKRNKPNLKVGTLIYCRVAAASKDLDPELSCISTQGVKKDWMTGESVFGELKEGLMVRCSIGLSRQLLSPECSVLSALEDKFAFEIAVGVNGAFWVKAPDAASTIAAANAILNSELLAPHEVHRMVKIVVDNIRRSS